MRGDVLYSYLRDQLERLTGERPEPDEDRDLPIAIGDVRVWISVVGQHDAFVGFLSPAAGGLEGRKAVHRRINELNHGLRFARVWTSGSTAFVGTELWGSDLTPEGLEQACRHVATTAQRVGIDLADHVGARPCALPSAEDDEATSVATVTTISPYL